MEVYILLLSLFASICFVVDAELHPIETQDLQSIVDSVKKDVDSHLKMMSAGQRHPSHDLKELPKAAIVENIDDFIVMIQDSMRHHLVKNLGQPSDAENGGTTEHSRPTTEDSILMSSTESVSDYNSELPSKSKNEDASESSEQVYEMRVGSAKGVPGVNFPNYMDIPITTFTCSDKVNLPGFYADLDTGCQVFHVCWPDRRESFLCPMGTIFNQALQVCDYWYNSNCSLAPYYYSMNLEMESDKEETKSSMINVLLEKADTGSTSKPEVLTDTSVLSFISQFMPVKAKIVYTETPSHRPKIVASASIGESNKPDSKSKKSPKPVPLSDKLVKSQSTDHQMAELKSNIFAAKFTEALDRILKDVKSDNSVSKLLWYVENVVKFLKDQLENYMRGLTKLSSFEPGSELYVYDMITEEAFQKLPAFVKMLLMKVTTFMSEVETRMKIQKRKMTQEVHKPVTLEHTPLTHLNPRFILKPTIVKAEKSQLRTIKRDIKRSKIIHPLKLFPEDKLNICSSTKKALLKNYIKLFKTKFA